MEAGQLYDAHLLGSHARFYELFHVILPINRPQVVAQRLPFMAEAHSSASGKTTIWNARQLTLYMISRGSDDHA